MGINVGLANSQANACSRYASDLIGIRNSLNQYKSSLGSLWDAPEMKYVHLAIDGILNELFRVSNEMTALGSDISSAAAEIRREEEAREAAARAAAARAAAEAAAREAAMRQLFHF